jgi:hypothetical protein
MKLICSLLAAGSVALLATVTVTAAPMSPPKLVGTVGPGFSISLKQNGKKVTALRAGAYTFVISDKANIHNFQLQGNGLNRALTSVSFVGTKTMIITLKKGTYKFFCVPHQSSMHGTFKVA